MLSLPLFSFTIYSKNECITDEYKGVSASSLKPSRNDTTTKRELDIDKIESEIKLVENKLSKKNSSIRKELLSIKSEFDNKKIYDKKAITFLKL